MNLNFSSSSPTDFNYINNQLEKFGLNSYQHRIFIRLMTFCHKLFTNEFVPANLKNIFVENNFPYNLRNSYVNTYVVPNKGNLNNYGEKTFHYFFSKFINTFCKNNLKNDFLIPFEFFKIRTINNVNLNFKSFICNFKNFDIKYIL